MAARKKTPAKRKPPAGKRGARKAATKTKGSAKARADAAAEEAKTNGARGKRLPAAKQQLRDSMIIARHAQGVGIPAIAAEAGVSTRTVDSVLAEAKKSGWRGRSPLDDSPMQILEELASGFRLSIGDFEAMALAWFDTNQSASLGAKKAAVEARAQLAGLMAEVGKLPTDLELFKSEMEMRRIAEEMVRVMQAVAAGEMEPDEAARFFRTVIGEPENPAAALAAA